MGRDWILDVTVDGIPKGQPRGRAFVTGGRARIWTPGTAEAWKGDIARALGEWESPPLARPLALEIVLYFPRPKRLMRKKDPAGYVPHTATPDWDNCGKAITDALEHLGVIANDKWLVQVSVLKLYHGKAEPYRCRPGARLRMFDYRGTAP